MSDLTEFISQLPKCELHLDRDLRVTVNSDDPAYFRGRYVTEAILMQHDAAPLSRDELDATASQRPPPTRAVLRASRA